MLVGRGSVVLLASPVAMAARIWVERDRGAGWEGGGGDDRRQEIRLGLGP